MSNIRCDGCGQLASEEHFARRIRRLELATRFRPIHIQILYLAEAPPPRLENYFYFPNEKRESRTGLSRVLFDELMLGLNICPERAMGDEPFLTEFQKCGYFLTDVLECPYEDAFPNFQPGTPAYSPPILTHNYAPTVIKRVLYSYKPKHIVLISSRMRHLIPYLESAALADRLCLFEALPLHFPHPANPAAQTAFRKGLAEILARISKRPVET